MLIGAGKLGQLIARVLRIGCCRLRAVPRYPQQEKLLQAAGVECVPAAAVEAKSVDVVIEATGSREGLLSALAWVKPRGRVVLKSTYRGVAEVDFSRVVVDEITLMGSRCGPFEPAIRLLGEGKIDSMPLIDSMLPLSEGLQALQCAAQPGICKVLLENQR